MGREEMAVKYLCASVALLCCAWMLFGCVAEAFGAPNGPLPSPMVLDRVFTGCCTICCAAAFKRLVPATIGLWAIVVTDAVESWFFDNPWHRFLGIWTVGAIAATFLTLPILVQRFKLFPEER